MSGFLASLVARARGEARAIRPRLPSRFETPIADTPADNPFGEIIEEFPSETPPSVQPACETPFAQPETPPQPTPDTPGVRRTATPVTTLANVPPAAAPELRANEFAPPAVAVSNPTPDAPSRTEQASSAPSPVEPITIEFAPPAVAVSNPTPDAPSRTEQASSAPSPVEPITIIRESTETRIVPQRVVPARVNVAPVPPARPGQNVPPFAAQQQQQHPAPQPTIEVTIGRIEVRATQPATAPSRAAAPSPVMSLDDYLRARVRGGR